MIGYAWLAAAILQTAVIRASEAERHKKEEEEFRKLILNSLSFVIKPSRKQVGEAVSSLLRRLIVRSLLCSLLRVAVSSS